MSPHKSADLPLQTHWNEEFQTAYSMDQNTPYEKLQRSQAMRGVYLRFVKRATSIAKVIVEESASKSYGQAPINVHTHNLISIVSIVSSSKTFSGISNRGLAGVHKRMSRVLIHSQVDKSMLQMVSSLS